MTTVDLGLPATLLTADSLQIAGFAPFSSVDWPGRLSATLFLQGCPWECTYCHNPSMQDSRAPGSVPWSEVVDTLHARRGLLDAVVFSGGEPTRQLGLADAMRRVQALGFAVGLHTAGAYPGRLAQVLPLVDWVGIDIKAAPAAYSRVTGQGTSGVRAFSALELVQRSGVDYEVRLTVDPTVHSRADVYDAVRDVIRRGAKAPVLQQARPDGANPEYAAALGGRGLYDVIGHDDLPDLSRR